MVTSNYQWPEDDPAFQAENNELVEALRDANPIPVSIGPLHAYSLIGLLQSALKQPEVTEFAAMVARDVIGVLRKHLPDACQASIDQGFGREPEPNRN
jgi:hypothetical protein